MKKTVLIIAVLLVALYLYSKNKQSPEAKAGEEKPTGFFGLMSAVIPGLHPASSVVSSDSISSVTSSDSTSSVTSSDSSSTFIPSPVIKPASTAAAGKLTVAAFSFEKQVKSPFKWRNNLQK